MPAPDTIDPASLDRFIESLLDAGFEPTGDRRSWVGPLVESLAPLTDAITMRVVARDGWPFIQPRVYVIGLPIGRHRNADGDVCMWEVGDPSLEWLTWPGVAARIDKWAAEAQGHATADDPGLDPHLPFSGSSLGLATIDLTGRVIRDWDLDVLKATRSDRRLGIGEGDLVGRWYVRDRPKSPPQTLEDLRSQLRRRQRDDLDAALKTVGQPDGLSFVVFAWNTPVGPNLLIVGLALDAAGQITAGPYEAARTDEAVLRLRAGPDAAVLADKSVVLFGVGAIGSHVADLVARCGLGRIAIYDRQILRPGDVVRHAASGLLIGKSKVEAMWLSTVINAPWTRMTRFSETWAPTTLRAAAAAADVVVDATGIASFTAQLSVLCRAAERPVVSVALYRHGEIGRMRFQSAASEIVVTDRPDDARFPKIQALDGEEEVSWEAGCADPIAQAPPTSVVGIAATTARFLVDLLTGRETEDLDLIEVYRPAPDTELDAVGARRYPTR